jgi:hypothetical protein
MFISVKDWAASLKPPVSEVRGRILAKQIPEEFVQPRSPVKVRADAPDPRQRQDGQVKRGRPRTW